MPNDSENSVDKIVKFTEKFSKETDKFEILKHNTELPAKIGGALVGGGHKALQLKEMADSLKSFNQKLFEIGGASIAGGVATDFAAPLVLYSLGAARDGLSALGDSFNNIGKNVAKTEFIDSINNTNETTDTFLPRINAKKTYVASSAIIGPKLDSYTTSLMDFGIDGKNSNSRIRIPISTLKMYLDNKDQNNT